MLRNSRINKYNFCSLRSIYYSFFYGCCDKSRLTNTNLLTYISGGQRGCKMGLTGLKSRQGWLPCGGSREGSIFLPVPVSRSCLT